MQCVSDGAIVSSVHSRYADVLLNVLVCRVESQCLIRVGPAGMGTTDLLDTMFKNPGHRKNLGTIVIPTRVPACHWEFHMGLST